MFARALGLFLASVLFWTSLSTFEGLDTAVPAQAAQAYALAQDGPLRGTVDEHHLDDLPSHAHAEAQGEPVALPAVPHPAQPLAAPALAPSFQGSRTAKAPALDGPRRPPRLIHA